MNKPIWDKTSLNKILRQNFQDYLLVIVSNREPYAHVYNKKGEIKLEASIGGVSVAFDSIMKKTAGIWVANGGGEADKLTVDSKNHVYIPPRHPRYTLRRIWISKKEAERYYDGFANQTLWPLCHVVFMKPVFREEDWQAYQKINKRFARAVLDEIKGQKALVWIQDYHLALVSQYIRQKRPDALIAQFWHIPWPAHEVFRICPWRREILTGLLHNDLIGFHQYHHVSNFFDNVSREIEAKVNSEDLIIGFQGRDVKVGSFPISIDYADISAKTKTYTKDKKIIQKYVKGKYEILALGIDRLDYTKGIPNRLLAIEEFLEDNPEYQGRFVYLGIAAPTRSSIKAYRDLNMQVISLTKKINGRFGTDDWQPISLVAKAIKHEEVLRLLKFADLCLVTPLDDGMNLVAKEYVSANKGDGALILSSYIGAAKELTESYFVNPYSSGDIAGKISEALLTPPEIRREKMKKMKKIVEERNIFRWAGKIFLELANRKDGLLNGD